MSLLLILLLVLVMPIMHVFKNNNNVALQFCAVDRLSNLLELENERGPPPGRTPALDDRTTTRENSSIR